MGIMQIKDVLKKNIESLEVDDIALFLSGGMDSIMLLVCLLELNKKVHVYSFTREGHASSDYMRASVLAEHFNLPFTGVGLKMDDREYLIKQLKILKYSYGAKKKTEFECCFPFLEAAPLVTQPYVLTGHGSDQNFCIAKSAMLHWRDKIDEYRMNAHKNPMQYKILSQVFAGWGSHLLPYPYQSKEMNEWFQGKSWHECNSPKQKQLLLNSFEGVVLPIELEKHSNLQMGDSGIRDMFEAKLLEGTKFKNTIAIYNRI